MQKEGTQPLAGYLSLHQYGDALNLKWTPNQLMNGCSDANNTHDKKYVRKQTFRISVGIS